MSELRRQGVFENTVIIIMADNERPFPCNKTRVYDSWIKKQFIFTYAACTNKKGIICNRLINSIEIAPTIIKLAGLECFGSFQGKRFISTLKYPESEFRHYVLAEHNWHDYEALKRMIQTKDFMFALNIHSNLSNFDYAEVVSRPFFLDLRAFRDSAKFNTTQIDIFVSPRPNDEFFNYTEDTLQLINVASLPKYMTKIV